MGKGSSDAGEAISFSPFLSYFRNPDGQNNPSYQKTCPSGKN